MFLQALGKLILRESLKVILRGIIYHTGTAVLRVLSLGRLRLAPLHTSKPTNPGRNRSNDWSIWLYGRRDRALKASVVCLVGIAVWIGAGVGGYQAIQASHKRQDQKLTSSGDPQPRRTSAHFPPIQHAYSGSLPAQRLINLFWRENIPVDVECASHVFNTPIEISPQETDPIALLDKLKSATGYDYRIEAGCVTIFDPRLGKANPLDRPVGPLEWKETTLSESIRQLGETSGVPMIHIGMSPKAWQTEPTLTGRFPGGTTREALNFLASSFDKVSWYTALAKPPDKTKPAALIVSFSSGVPGVPASFQTQQFETATRWEPIAFRLDDTTQLAKPPTKGLLTLSAQHPMTNDH